MTQHTPGPWEITQENSGKNYAIILAKYLKITVDCRENFGNVESDARLISSAPELLEACKAFLDPLITIEEKVIIAQQALKKAGE